MSGRAAALIAAAVALAAPLPGALAQDELPPERDTGRENSCGNPCTPSSDPPPREACKDVRSELGSVVLRRVPAGPLRADGSLAFRSGICVYLPPGYEASGLRYPVVYLLHGGGGDQGDWISQGFAQKVLDDAYRADARAAAIVVTPDGTPDASWFDRLDGSSRNQEYVLGSVIPYVDRRFRTIADRRGRAIAGLSNGGHGTLYLASTRPDLFAAAGSMSGNVGWQSFTNGEELDKSSSPAWFNGHLPKHLAPNLDGLDLVFDIGASCSSDAARDFCGTWAFEQIFLQDNRDLIAALNEVRHAGVHDYRETEGSHAWRWWSLWLRERQLPFLLARLDDPESTGRAVAPSPPRLPFRYRSVLDRFSVYGYDVEVRRAAREFLDLRDVDRDGLTAVGSGTVEIVTAPLYAPAARYRVLGEGGAARVARAGADGRLRLTIDLGPAHEHEQFSEAQTRAEAAGNYWTSRRVRIEAVPAACSDRQPPVTSVRRLRVGRTGVSARGRSADAGCAGPREVLVAVALVDRGRCRFLGSNGRLRGARRCGRPVWLRARGTRAWALRRRAALPAGTYRVWVSGVDAAGNRERGAPLRRVVR